jgi:hypothetical protein
MTEIDVQTTKVADPFVFRVTVTDRTGKTRHRVTLARADYERLSGGEASPEALVSESFRFLLEREPKEAILPSFDLPVIGRYFPEYERSIRQRV